MAAGKKAGRKSQASNDFLEPLAPTGVTGTNVGTGRAFNNGAVSVAFSLPALSPAATSYTVTASTGQTATGSSSPIVVQGIASAATPTFTVTATNAAGTSTASSASAAVTVTTVPATPGAPSASSPSAGNDSVSWTAPATGGSAITNYFWSSSDGKSGNTASTSVTVAQEQGTAQTYTVRADNANGSSTTSSASPSVTTVYSFTPYSFTPYSFTPYSFTPFSFTPFSFTPAPPFSFTPFSFTPAPFAFTPFTFTPPPFSFTPAPPYSFTPYSFTPSGGCRGFKPYPYCFCQGTLWTC